MSIGTGKPLYTSLRNNYYYYKRQSVCANTPTSFMSTCTSYVPTYAYRICARRREANVPQLLNEAFLVKSRLSMAAFQLSADSFGIRRLGFKCSWWHPRQANDTIASEQSIFIENYNYKSLFSVNTYILPIFQGLDARGGRKLRTDTDTYTHRHTHRHTDTDTHTHTDTDTHTHTDRHTHTHRHTQTHTHTHTHSKKSKVFRCRLAVTQSGKAGMPVH